MSNSLWEGRLGSGFKAEAFKVDDIICFWGASLRGLLSFRPFYVLPPHGVAQFSR